MTPNGLCRLIDPNHFQLAATSQSSTDACAMRRPLALLGKRGFAYTRTLWNIRKPAFDKSFTILVARSELWFQYKHMGKEKIRRRMPEEPDTGDADACDTKFLEVLENKPEVHKRFIELFDVNPEDEKDRKQTPEK